MQKAFLLAVVVVAQFVTAFTAEASHTRGSTIYWKKHPSINDAIIVYSSVSTRGGWNNVSLGSYRRLGNFQFGTSVTMEYYSGSGSTNTVTSSSTSHNPNGVLFYSSSIEDYTSSKLVHKDASGNLVDGAIVRFPQNTVWPIALNFQLSCCRVGTMNETQGAESNGGTLINLNTPNSSPVSSSPAVIQVPSSFIGSQTPFTYQIVASDPDNDGLRFNQGTTTQFGGNWLASGTFPTGLTISNSGLLTWQIPTTVNGNTVSSTGRSANYLSNLAFTIEDYDPLDPNATTKSRASYDIILRIAETSSNQPPQIVSLPQTTQFTPYVLGTGTTYNFTITAQDLYDATTNTLPGSGGYLTVTEVSQIPNFTYSTSNLNGQTVLNCSFTPSSSQAGNAYTAVFQFDDGSLITFANVSIQVANNPRPIITDFQLTGNTCTGVVFSGSNFTSNYSDPDSDPLEWVKLTSLPSTGLLIFKGNPVISGDEILLSEISNLTYSNATPGTYTISWEAKDDQGNWSTTTETITMVVEGVKTSGSSNTSSSTTSPAIIDSQVSVVFNGSKTSASVAITSGYLASDILQVAVPIGISATATYSNGTLSINGTFTDAELQSIFRLVEFQSVSNSQTRTFTFQVGSSVAGCDPFIAIRTLNNTLPTITGSADQSTCLTGTTPTLNITLGDTETPVANLVLSVLSSSNAAAVPVSNVVFGGSGSSRTVDVTNSGVYGSSLITLAVTDAGGGVATESFVWSNTASDGIALTSGTTFNPYAGTPLQIDRYLVVVSGTTISGALVSVNNFNAGDELAMKSGYSMPSGLSALFNSSTGVLTLTGTVTAADIQSALRNVVFSTTSTIEVSRNIEFTLGVPNSGNCFNLSSVKVFDLNQTPTISGPATSSICIGNALSSTESFSVGDANDGTGNLGLTLISSSNTTLVPLVNVSFGGSGASRSVTATVPNNATSGSSTLVIEVSDRYGKSATHSMVFTYAACASTVTTGTVSNTLSTTSSVGGDVTNQGGTVVTDRGIVYGTSTAPTVSGSKAQSGTGTGTFTANLTGLLPNTLYYCRAYAVSGQGTAYGNEISFYTRPIDITGVTSSNFNATHQANVICYGESTTLTAAGVSGVVYWYTGSCGGTQVGTGNTLTVSPTTTTTYYARNYNNNLFSDGCASITVVVRPQLVAPTIVGAETICWNSQATGLTGTQATGGSSAAASAGFSYQWQKSEDNGQTWQNLTSQTNYASLMPGYLYQTTQYRLLATDLGSPACTTNIASNVIQVTVRDPFTPSVVSTTNPNNTVCQAGSVNLTATPTIGGSGPLFLYQWQRSFDSINWVDEGPALQNTTAYTVATVTTDTYYRLIAFDLGTPACGSVFSTNAVFARVQTAVTQGSISGAQHICAGTAPTAAIASVTVGTGRGTISYRWEASTDNGQTWSTVSGATGASYQPGVLQTTTDYRRFAVSTFNSVACESLQPTSVVRIVVDQVPVATITAAGTTSCVNAAVPVPGVTINHGTAVWTHNGQGAISGSLTAPVYTPVAADAGNSVTLTLTVTGTAICLNVPAVDTYVIVVDRLPVATAGGSATICENSTHTLVGAVAQNGTILWTHNGTGSLAGTTTLTPTYTAAAGDAGQTVTLTMTVSSTNTCSPATASATYTVIVNQLPAASAGGTQTICSLASATVSGASSARGTILWTHNGSGSISGATTLTPTYTAGAADAGTTVTMTMTVTSTNVCGPQTATATYTVVVRPDFVPATFVNQKQDLCYNTGASQITATAAMGGTGPYAYQWQVSTDSTTWSNINGAVSLTYTPSGTFTSSRYYRILSTDLGTPTCGTTLAGAADVKLLVRSPLTPPALAAVTICQGTSTTLTPSLALGGRNNFTYQWQQSANGTTGWTNVGTASANIAFTTPNLTGTTFYRVIARDENVTLNNLTYISCGSTFSQSIRVTVAATTTAGALSGDETTCVSAATAAIASATSGTGSGVISYRWELSIDNGTNWTAIQGAIAATYAPGVLSQTTMYRRITVSLQSGLTCESAPTASVTKTVQQLAVFTAAGSNVSTNTDLGLPTAVVNYTVTATAVTPVTLTYAFTGATAATGNGTGSGAAFGIGTTTVTVTATTQCGVSTSTFTVEVIDNENPVITSGSDLNVSTTTATTGCAMPVTVTSPVATDNASGVQVSYVLTGATTGSGTSITGVSFNVGTTVITWTATDG